ncbi:MAG: hypothetical protein QY326_09725 [Bdellovibrionota bacterium]|nr:MAG: hypothetical protein QY326_09725 [Bdellovibrionota bacterium]
MQQQRYFESQRVYEACIRVREGIAFPTLRLMNHILLGILGRVQRDRKIVICHYLWMGNHLHIMFVMQDAEACICFFSEIQKQITDALKKLLGLSFLHLWEGEPSISIILDPEKAEERIRYIYCNPARAHLVKSIDDYPGLSSYQAFLKALPDVAADISEEVPWLRRRALPVLPSRLLSRRQDYYLSEKLLSQKHRRHTLSIYPNRWLKTFGITDPAEITAANGRILRAIKEHEAQYSDQRKAAKTKIVGAHRLAEQPILQPHTPKARSRRIYVLSSIAERRAEYITLVKSITALCRELYQLAKRGCAVIWPPGVFPPRIPRLANALG